MTVQGIDVSHWQGNVDWSKVYQAGKRFAGIKATENTTYVDPLFAANRTGAETAGLIVLEYHFNSGGSGTSQAAHFINTVGTSKTSIKVLDFEGGKMTDAEARAFAGYVNSKATGKKALYSTEGSCDRLLGYPEFKGWLRWIALWGVKPNNYNFWQKSAGGFCSGVTGNCDLDEFNGTLSALKALVGTPVPIPQPIDLLGGDRVPWNKESADGYRAEKNQYGKKTDAELIARMKEWEVAIIGKDDVAARDAQIGKIQALLDLMTARKLEKDLA